MICPPGHIHSSMGTPDQPLQTITYLIRAVIVDPNMNQPQSTNWMLTLLTWFWMTRKVMLHQLASTSMKLYQRKRTKTKQIQPASAVSNAFSNGPCNYCVPQKACSPSRHCWDAAPLDHLAPRGTHGTQVAMSHRLGWWVSCFNHHLWGFPVDFAIYHVWESFFWIKSRQFCLINH